jgi:hypothetical protein
MRLRDVGLNSQDRCPTCPVAAATRTRRGEGGKDSTLDVAKAIADYASS